MRSLFSLTFAFAMLLTAAACGSASPASAGEHETFIPGDFGNPLHIDNKWYPLEPGTQYVYEGFSNDDNGNRVARRLVVTVTDLTKVINGVPSVVSWDRDYNAGELVEAEIAFYAQDDKGNVWRMGEHPEEYKGGKFADSPTWIAGIDGAVAGIEMQADPQQGQPSYSQGWSPGVDFTDRGQVSQVGQKKCVKAGCYEDLVVISETSKAEPDAFQLKYYAPGVGNVFVNWQGADNTQESLELAQVVQLDPAALAEARASALELEQSAYIRSKDVYGITDPAQ